MKHKSVITASIFCGIVVVLFVLFNRIFSYSDDTHTKQLFEDYYDLPKESVDVIWLGASAVQSGILPSVLYDDCGVAEYSLATSSQPFCFSKYLIEEAKKTQNPKVFLVDIRMLAYDSDVMGNPVISENYIRHVTDNMKFSVNRKETIDYMLEELGRNNPGETYQTIDYYFPWMLYHSKWMQPESVQIGRDLESYMGAYTFEGSIELDKDEVRKNLSSDSGVLSENNQRYLDDFLDYCDDVEYEIYFTQLPHGLDSEKCGIYNRIKEEIQNRGYEVIDFNDYIEDIGLDYKNDFAEAMHLNKNGALKVSHFAAKFLKEKFDLPERSGNEYEMYVEAQNRLEQN